MYGFASLTPAAAVSGGVAFWAHLGGFVSGLALISPFAGRVRRRTVWREW